jgi:hypothetical protein
MRHGEKPDPTDATKPPLGVGLDGRQSIHGLTPRGWQRAGALVRLFVEAAGTGHDGPPAAPDRLVAAGYGTADETRGHRPYLTLTPLADKLGRDIGAPRAIGEEDALAADVLAADNECTLICWEHAHIPLIAAALPLDPAHPAPRAWPDERFDLLWCFERGDAAGVYRFTVVGQRLLAGDAEP